MMEQGNRTKSQLVSERGSIIVT